MTAPHDDHDTEQWTCSVCHACRTYPRQDSPEGNAALERITRQVHDYICCGSHIHLEMLWWFGPSRDR